MAKNSGLSKAKNAKKDEFYTSYEVIQAEINHYEDKFKNKTVLCNCDDPFESNFCKFFLRNFNYLKLKRLICTSYSTSPIVGQHLTLVGWNEEPIKRGNGYVMDISEVPMANGRGVSDSDIDSLLKSKNSGVKKLKGDGDFRSDECIEYMKQADVVITNPPFSLFREYVAQLIEYEKNFLIIGNVNAITYKEIFPLIKDNKMWLGASIHSGDRKFYVPDDYPLKASGCGEDENGRKFIRVKGVRWFTNLDYTKRHEELVLYKKYYGNEEEYPKYDNYDAINVDKTADIPCDYFEYMAVPITYTDKYNPDQFEIINANDIRTNPDTPIKAHGLIKDKDAVITTQIYTKNAEKDLTQTAKTGTILTDRQTDRQTNHICKNCHQEKDVTESWECLSHSSTNTTRINLKLSDLRQETLEDLPELLHEQEKMDHISVENSATEEFLSKRRCSGIMGVPITFLDKYNPEQFEIIGLTQRGCHDESLETKKYNDFWEMRPDGTKTGSSGNKTNGNPNIAKNDGKHNYFVNREGYIVQSCYQRILIKRRKKDEN